MVPTFSNGDSGVGGSTLSIAAGSRYQVGVKDNKQCTFGYPAVNKIDVTTPSTLTISDTTILAVDPSCGQNDGSITLNDGGFTITGGSTNNTGDYTNLTFGWTSSNGNSYNTQDIFNLPPGQYTLTED